MVKLEIDMKTASKEDIKRTIEFLKKYIGEEDVQENMQNVSEGMFNIFNSEDKKEDKPEQKDDSEESTEYLGIKPIFY